MKGASVRPRRKTKSVKAGNIIIGGDAPVSLQSMTNCPLSDEKKTIEQIQNLVSLGADIIRVALRTEEEICNLEKVLRSVDACITADIHFNYRLALGAINAGVHKVRINPGNIGSAQRVKEVVAAASERGVPIRIGVNGGSVDRKRFPEITPEALVESALEHIVILEDMHFNDIVVSIKSSDIFHTIEANRLFSEKRDYPLHIGLTEAGYGLNCTVQSSIAIGHLLLCGYGDTIRVSMTGDPSEEIIVGRKILESIGERIPAIKMISCPTCGRTAPELDILALARALENECHKRFATDLESAGKTLVVAVMGCEVNGPGEAAHADIGLAGGRHGSVLLFSRGKKLRKVNMNDAVKELIDEAAKLVPELILAKDR